MAAIVSDPPVTGTARILVAEDSALMSAVLKGELDREGHLVDIVADGRSALDAVLGPEPPDLLITDGDMPRMGGIDLCRDLRRRGRTLPIIFLTASATQLSAALDAGADDFVRKPFEPAELSARVRAALRAGLLASQLEAERDRSAALMSSLQDGLIVMDRTGRIVDANASMSTITGLARETLVGMRPPFSFWPDDRADDYAHALLNAIARGASSEADREYRAADGRVLDVIVNLARVRADVERAGQVVYVSTIKDVTERRASERALRESEARHRALAREQARLSRVAATVAASDDPEEVFALVAREVAGLLGGHAGGVTRFDGDAAVLVGSWAAVDELRLPVGSRFDLTGGSATARVRSEGRAVRIDDYSALGGEIPAVLATAHLSSVAAPVRVGGRLWGTVGAISTRRGGFLPGAETRLEQFATLVGVAVTGADARAELALQALTDPLTGLANRRAFTERFEGEVTAARELSGPLSLVMLDLDHFKAVNDRHGHEVGDTVLRELARRMTTGRRDEDLVARIGGEEFAVILPGAGRGAARAVAELIRVAVREKEFPVAGTCTISCGVAHWEAGDDSAALMRRADANLYRAKAAGRDRVVAEGEPGT
jgi:diguanylate cyclase (GGDEF)-like protein/PAS domain S-box-containing protein